MRKIIFGVISCLAFVACQTELYEDPQKQFKVEQAVYVKSDNTVSLYVEQGMSMDINSMQIALTRESDVETEVELEIGNIQQLERYNKEHGTSYVLLPDGMFEVSPKIVLPPKYTTANLKLKLKDIKFSLEGTYALPVKIKKSSVGIIDAESEGLIVFEQRTKTKVLRINGYGTEDANMFPNDFKVPQWTMEVMVNRSSYASNNRSICGTKLVPGASTQDEIYTRFGDVTIDPNQLQIKTASSQIDVPKSKFAAKPDTWYMISFVYDGKKNMVYVNGVLVAEREMRDGAYGMVGFWIGGANELIREVRFYKTARTQKQIVDNLWKTVDPNDENLLLYYPMNGKKIDKKTGEITEDETQVWDWSNSGKHLSMPKNASWNDNSGKLWLFPEK